MIVLCEELLAAGLVGEHPNPAGGRDAAGMSQDTHSLLRLGKRSGAQTERGGDEMLQASDRGQSGRGWRWRRAKTFFAGDW